MYSGYTKTQIVRHLTEEGQSIEEKIAQAIANNEPIEATAGLMYTPCKEGVLPQTDVRTDKQEIAIDACTKFDKSERAKGMDARLKEAIEKKENKNETKNE